MTPATIVELFRERSRSAPAAPALRWSAEAGRWQSLTWGGYARAVAEVAVGLRAWGLAGGERAAILSTNRPDWHVADLGIMAAGMVSVPVYATNSASQVAHVLGHSGARVCVAENLEQAAKVILHRADLPELMTVVVMGDVDGFDDPFVRSLGELRATGSEALDADPGSFDALVEAVDPGAVATLVYTSGTTGHPKGAMISHANIAASLRSLDELVQLRPDDRFLSFLPLSHITERTISHFGHILAGGETWFAQGLTTVADDLQACRPTLFFAVPRVWEKFRERILDHVGEQRGVRGSLARRYLEVAGTRHVAAPARRLPGRTDVEFAALDRVVGATIRRRLGLDRARLLASGAAPVHPDLLRWFLAIGLPIAEGYGQTEASMCTTLNPPDDIRIGTVGQPIPGVTVRIADDGEVLVKGDSVCLGYWQDETASAALIDEEGWMHSGDLGTLAEDGYLVVTGRKKDLIITSYGKNVSPGEIETDLRFEPLISQAVVIGDGRPFLTALLTLDVTAAQDWASRTGHSRDIEVLMEDPDLLAEIDASVARVNAAHSRPEGIKAWRLLREELSLATGELTPTLKVKRGVVLERHAELVEEMYDKESAAP